MNKFLELRKWREKKINTDFSELSLRQNTNFSALTWLRHRCRYTQLSKREALHSAAPPLIFVCEFIIPNVIFFFGIMNTILPCRAREKDTVLRHVCMSPLPIIRLILFINRRKYVYRYNIFVFVIFFFTLG